jgi:acetyltransferase-like isoleucine patch superfamily enzyme
VLKGASVEDNAIVPSGTVVEKSTEPKIFVDLRRIEGQG